MITLLYGCFQVELTVRDLDAARDFMTGVLDGEGIEQELAKEIQDLLPGSGYRVDHLDCGQATFQVNQPPASGSYRGKRSVHQANLERVGPCVSNLNFYVDDIAHARELLSGLGAPTLTEGPSTAVRSLADYGPDNTRPGGGDRPFLFVGTKDRIGFDLEIMEPNFKRFVEQTAQHPCFVRPDEPDAGQGLRLERLRIAVDDLEETADNLARIFAPASLSRPYRLQGTAESQTFRVWLGGIELEYCQPSRQDGAGTAFLARCGPGVVTIEFSAPDPAAVAAQARNEWSLPAEPKPDPIDDVSTGWLIGCRDLVGFDVGLARRADPFYPLKQKGDPEW
jgi:catechol 2,3-dioxygenase-like lactoylglutathione lyase family enzyme